MRKLQIEPGSFAGRMSFRENISPDTREHRRAIFLSLVGRKSRGRLKEKEKN